MNWKQDDEFVQIREPMVEESQDRDVDMLSASCETSTSHYYFVIYMADYLLTESS